MASPDRIRQAAAIVAERKQGGDQPVVVVSAMAGETDRLIDLAHQMTPNPGGREYDFMVSVGEQVSTALVCMALQDMGIAARPFAGHQVPIITNDLHKEARIKKIFPEKLEKAIESGLVPVVTGFQGVTEEGEITTLGRGGSDTTAVALAVALKAAACEIFTDVNGVYTADPQVCPSARKIERISYEEMLEIAGLGAKVLHKRCVELAMINCIPILVKSTFQADVPGTWVLEEDENMEKSVVTGVTLSKGDAKVSIVDLPDVPGVASKVFAPLADAGINVDMIIQNVARDGKADLTFTVPREDLARTKQIAEKVAAELGASHVQTNTRIAKVSIVGAGMKTNPGVASLMFSTLAKENINIMMISTSEIKISCIIVDKYAELAVRVLHEAFGLGVNGNNNGRM